ncbi:RDD family protein [Mangrovimonas sp. AS39]|uniref:RDD family protein n=1 Tax=Mangrovimonas futianensis TaxID=2895523 RepID=UPI001E524EA9|nr:RDD family protein [Mangrovimonas futianensis]MCF1190771.1 RDD family protein [Mangrovimonas futianensis]MCF1194468.1 RDD family protein [Mangrovimonas futianensis]
MTSSYANLFDRAKAAFIDTIIIVAYIYAISELLNLFENVPDYIRMSFLALVILYEPLFVSFYGATMGHGFTKLIVQDIETQKKINFPKALIRFALKVLLGWLSFVIAMGNDKRQTIHDLVVNSVVVVE